MSIASLGATATNALSHALGHKHAQKPQQTGSMADLLAQLTGGSASQGSAQSGSAQSGSAQTSPAQSGASAVGKVAQDLLSMLGIGEDQAKPAASAASAYAAGTQLG